MTGSARFHAHLSKTNFSKQMDCRVKPGNDRSVPGADQNRIPAPQAIVGQPCTAPPAVDRVVQTEVFLVRDNRLAAFRQRQFASLVCLEPTPVITRLECAQFVVEAGYGRSRI